MSKKAANKNERNQFVMAEFDGDDINLYHKLKQQNWFATHCRMRPLAGGADTYSVEELIMAKEFMAKYRRQQRERQEQKKTEGLTEKEKKRREAQKKAEENARRKAEKRADKQANKKADRASSSRDEL